MSKKTFRSDEEKTAWGIAEKLTEIHWTYLERRGVSRAMAEIYIRRWLNAGLIEQIRKDGHRKIFGHVGQRVSPVRQGLVKTPEEAMWRVMNRFSTFTPVDLKAMAATGDFDIDLPKARRYCRQLLAAGYLRVRGQAVPGRREATYQLIDKTGVQAPIYRKISGVLDPNTGKFIPNMREGQA